MMIKITIALRYEHLIFFSHSLLVNWEATIDVRTMMIRILHQKRERFKGMSGKCTLKASSTAQMKKEFNF